MRKPQVLPIVVSFAACLPAGALPQATGGGFEDGQSGQVQDVASWFESSTGGASYTEWVNPSTAIQANSGSGYVASRHLALRGSGWIYQSLGTYDSARAPELGFRFYQGIFTDGNASTGANVAFFTTDGSFVPGEGVDIAGAAGVTQLGSTFSVNAAAVDGTGYRTGTIDLTGLTNGTEIWVRFAGNGNGSQFAPFDDLSFFQPGADSDGDGLSDEDEANIYGTDSQKRDTDGDGLEDGEEVDEYHTEPTDPDTDDDLYSDGDEVEATTDPLDGEDSPNFTGNGAIWLDGQSHLTFAPEAGVIPSGNQPFTVELWANPASMNPENEGGNNFIYWGNEAPHQANGFRISGSTVVRHYFWANDTVVDTGMPFVSNEGGPNADGWHHFAATYDGTRVSILVDGIVVGNSVPAAAANVIDANHLIGRKLSQTFGAGYFHGYLDEIRIWNTARSVDEIRGNFVDGLQGDEDGLVAYWDFNGSLEDQTSNGIILDPQGDVTYALEKHAPLGVAVAFPAPEILSFNRDPLGDVFNLTFSSLAGQLYYVESSEDLIDWSVIGQVRGSVDESSYSDDSATEDKKFYRVRE